MVRCRALLEGGGGWDSKNVVSERMMRRALLDEVTAPDAVGVVGVIVKSGFCTSSCGLSVRVVGRCAARKGSG